MEHTFVDAQEMVQLHPETFEAPTADELDQITEGTIVKICNGEERFWAGVTKVDGEKISASVDNDLLGDYGYNYGDIIEFEKRHIYSIFKNTNYGMF